MLCTALTVTSGAETQLHIFQRVRYIWPGPTAVAASFADAPILSPKINLRVRRAAHHIRSEIIKYLRVLVDAGEKRGGFDIGRGHPYMYRGWEYSGQVGVTCKDILVEVVIAVDRGSNFD